MEKMCKKWLPYMFAVAQWCLTLYIRIDKLFFDYNQITKEIIVVKILYLFVLILLWNTVFKVCEEIKNKNIRYIRGIHFFLIYLGILMIFVVVLWPGTWSWDDANCIIGEHYYSWNPWQHIITAIYHEILLQILPFPGGIILLQNIIIASIVSYVIVILERDYNVKVISNKFLDYFIKLLPFFMPPVLMYQFSGYRMGIYIYIELFMLIMLIQIVDGKISNWKSLILFSAIVGIIATWRTESLFYIPFIGIAILIFNKKKFTLEKKIGCLCLMVLVFGGISKVQNHMLVNKSYNIVSIMRPCAELVRGANKEKDKDLLNDISKVLDLDVIYENDDSGEKLFWGTNVVKKNYSDNEYRDFLKAFIKLSFEYPQTVIKERWNLFIVASGITGQTTTNIDYSYHFFDDNNNNTSSQNMIEQNWLLNKPLSVNLRKHLIHILGLQIGDKVLFMKLVIWNAIIPLGVLLVTWIVTLSKKKWKEWWILTAILIRVPVVILSQPSGWIMYYLSFYLLGYVVLVYGLLKKKGDMCKNG